MKKVQFLIKKISIFMEFDFSFSNFVLKWADFDLLKEMCWASFLQMQRSSFCLLRWTRSLVARRCYNSGGKWSRKIENGQSYDQNGQSYDQTAKVMTKTVRIMTKKCGNHCAGPGGGGNRSATPCVLFYRHIWLTFFAFVMSADYN